MIELKLNNIVQHTIFDALEWSLEQEEAFLFYANKSTMNKKGEIKGNDDWKKVITKSRYFNSDNSVANRGQMPYRNTEMQRECGTMKNLGNTCFVKAGFIFFL